jgi:LAO/AO transport system kinase
VAIEQKFIERILSGERIAVARGISLVENEHPSATDLLKALYLHTGNAYRIGITGPPGAGKSTITNKLAKLYRTQNKRVGIIAVDPTSPFTGGALLGDRVRMTDVELDEGVFIRSMASRGSLGGLSKKTKEAADVLDASGCDVVLFETVGVGQSELDIVRAADTTIVVLVPESGDSIQAMKAGLMEIADFFVVNKSDRPGAEQAVMSIKMVLQFKHPADEWQPEVIKAVANDGKGIEEISSMIDSHKIFLLKENRLQSKRKERVIERVRELVNDKLRVEFWNEEREAKLTSEIESVLNGRSTPYDLALSLVTQV